MSIFTYDQYTAAVSAEQNKTQTKPQNVRVGWFKLVDDGDEALVRINISSIEDLQFATIHQLGASTKWAKVSCLNELGSYENVCPFCKAIAAGNTAIGKADKRVYIPMLVSYKDKVSGQWSAPQPVIWDKKAGFSREIANKLRDFGDLKQVLLKITRNGAKGNVKTTYSIEYAIPTIYKPEMIPADFSAFENFRLDKHSFWVKTADEINTFLTTGSFPETQKTQPVETPVVEEVKPVYTAPVQQVVEEPVVKPSFSGSENATPRFNGFSF